MMLNSKINGNKVGSCFEGSIEGNDIDLDDNSIFKRENDYRR